MLALLRGAARGSLQLGRGAARATRAGIHFSAPVRDDDGDLGGDDDGDGDGVGAASSNKRRKGRMLLDPSAPRRQEGIRSDPANAEWGGMIDLLEHAAYCDGQREENEDGFFFDMTIADYDSDCEGDPFAANYLTEDEYEFSEEYVPSAYTPARIHDQIYFLHAVRGYSIPRLCTKYRLSCASPPCHGSLL